MNKEGRSRPREIELEEPRLLNRNIMNDDQLIPFIQNAQNEIPLTPEEKKMLVVLFLLYFIQGIPIGFFGIGCQLLLAEAGVTFADLAILSIMIYPFTVKLFTAPFLDTFYDVDMGKRKTYIVPLQYLLCLVYLLMGWFQFSVWIQDQKVIAITSVGFLCVLIVAQQDIAVDGWVLTALSYNYVHLGSSCQSIGQTTGTIFASSLMINFTSEKFAKSFLGRDQQLISIEQFCYIAASIIFIINIYVHFFTHEVEETEEEKQKRTMTSKYILLKEILTNIKQIISNNNIKFYIFYLVTYRLAFSAVTQSSSAKLVKEGFPKEIISTCQTLFVPIGIGLSIFVGAKMKLGREMPWALTIYKYRFLDTFIQFVLVSNFAHFGGLNVYTGSFIFIMLLCSMSLTQLYFVIHGGFANRISDAAMGATYLTLINSSSNLGLALSESISMTLIDKIGYPESVVLGWVLGAIYLISLKDKIVGLSKAPKTSWNIVNLV